MRSSAAVLRAARRLISKIRHSSSHLLAVQHLEPAAQSAKQEGKHGAHARSALNLAGFIGLGALVVGARVGTALALSEEEEGLPPPSYPWPHKGVLSGYDHPSIRRGFQVYQQVCSQCHSSTLITFGDLVGVSHTENEAKAMAAEVEVVDGPNEEGEMYLRPGRLNDHLPSPCPNEQAARAANEGAYPPDLSCIAKARHHGHDYIFALLTGYRDPPAGVKVREGLHYNPYFPGGAIVMPPMLKDGGVEYDDGAPPVVSQMAKDVTCFLAWAAEPELEERKLMGIKWIFIMVVLYLETIFFKRFMWAPYKVRKLIVDVVN